MKSRLSTKFVYTTILALSFLYIFLLLKIQFIAWPEMLTWPYLTSIGLNYYENIFSVYPPLLLKLLSLISSYHWGINTLRLVSTLFTLANFILLSLILSKRVKGKVTFIISLLLFIFWQLRYEVNGLWFDHVVALFSLIQYFFLTKRKYALSAIAAGLAILTKQTAIIFLLPIVFNFRKPQKILNYYLISTLVVVIGYLLFIRSDLLPLAYQQSIVFPLTHMSSSQSQRQLPNFQQLILFLIPFMFLSSLFLTTHHKNKLKKERVILLIFYFCSLFLAWPRFELFHLLPSINFLLLYVSYLPPVKHSKLLIAGFSIISSVIFLEFYNDYKDIPTKFLNPSIILDSQNIKGLIGDSSFYSINSWDHWYFLARAKPAIDFVYPSTPLYYDYPVIQEETIEKLSSTTPEFILLGKNTNPTQLLEFINSKYEFFEEINPETFLYRIKP